MLSSLTAHIAVISGEGVVIAVNQAWERFARENGGQSELGENYLTVCERAAKSGDEIARNVLGGIQSVLDGEEVDFDLEYPCHSATEKRWFLMQVAPLMNGESGVVISHTDITERRIIEGNLIRSEARLRHAQAVAHVGCWEIDLRTDDVWWSPECYNICGIDPGSGFVPTKENTFDLFILPEYRATLREKGIEAIKRDEPYKLEARIRRHSDRKIRTIELNGIIEKNNAREPVAILGTVQDITERKHLETALQQKNRALEISNAELQDFAYAASHDLKEPLRTVSVYLGLLNEDLTATCQLDEDTAEYLEFIQEAAGTMNDLIQDLLVYSRVTTRTSQFETVDTNVVVEEAIKNLRGRIEETGAQITKEGLPTLTSDPVRLGQVFQNLLSNSLKFIKSDEKPVISISALKRNDIWRFSVSDNGIGIDAEFIDTIFRPFYRLHSNEEIAGSGIGLAIVKKIIDRWGGTVWVESEVGQGATFFFTLKENHDA